MLHGDIERIASPAQDRLSAFVLPALLVGAAVTVLILAASLGHWQIGLTAALAMVLAVFWVYRPSQPAPLVAGPLISAPDYSVVGAALNLSSDPAALTSSEGSMRARIKRPKSRRWIERRTLFITASMAATASAAASDRPALRARSARF